MIRLFRAHKKAIQSVQVTNDWDKSLKALNLTNDDWRVLDDIHEFFEIFAKHTEDIQAQKYPTLQRTIPTFIAILRQLRVL